MTKNLKLWVKIKGDKKWYDVTEFEDKDSVSVFDKETGDHLDFDWDEIEGFESRNPKLFNSDKKYSGKDVANIVRNFFQESTIRSEFRDKYYDKLTIHEMTDKWIELNIKQ